MTEENYNKFVAQFTAKEWKGLCHHRLFLHFLRTNLKTAAIVAAEALGRPVTYVFPVTPAKTKKSKVPKKSATKLYKTKAIPPLKLGKRKKLDL